MRVIDKTIKQLLLFSAFTLGLGSALSAQNPPAASDSAIQAGEQALTEAGATTRAARLSFVQGKVDAFNSDNTDSGIAQVNMPLLQGQRVITGDDGQAEIEFEDGSVVRITPNSSVSLAKLDAENGRYLTQISLDSGLAYFELRVTNQYGYYVFTPSGGITPIENSTLRVSLDHPPAEVAVMQGSVHMEREAGFSTNIKSGESLRADASASTRYILNPQIAYDSWDNWNEERDQAAAQQASMQTEARNDNAGDAGYGWSDLDASGNWYDLPGQGRVWQPAVATSADWDPYGYGSWTYYPGPGYVWVSGYSWGWTPYHCGNWSFYDGFGWGWSSGLGCNRWGWAGFYGGGGGWRINVLRGPTGWRPIQRPIPGPPGRPRPLIPVRRNPVVVDVAVNRRPVNFNGHIVQPLRPLQGPYIPRGGSAVGAALNRDFPMNRQNHTPVTGFTAGSRPAENNGYQRIEPIRPITPPVPTGGWRTVPSNRPAPGIQQNRPASTPQPANRPMPAPQINRPAPPPQPRPNFAPHPPSAPHPAPAPHSAPPPPHK